MKIQELRSGNWVKAPTSLDKKIILPEYYAQILGFHYSDLVFHCNPIAVSNWEIPVKHCAPIPLTEKWLKKLGFEKLLDADNVFTKIKPDEVYFNLYQYGFDFDWVHREDTLSRIKYVHQLQNLYFALTQKELTTLEPVDKVKV